MASVPGFIRPGGAVAAAAYQPSFRGRGMGVLPVMATVLAVWGKWPPAYRCSRNWIRELPRAGPVVGGGSLGENGVETE